MSCDFVLVIVLLEGDYAYSHAMVVVECSMFHLVGTLITCPPPEGCVPEGTTFMMNCTRVLDLTVQSIIMVSSMDGTATGKRH